MHTTTMSRVRDLPERHNPLLIEDVPHRKASFRPLRRREITLRNR